MTIPGIAGAGLMRPRPAVAVADISYEESSEANNVASVSLSATIPASCKMVIVFHHITDDDSASYSSDSCTVGGSAATATTEHLASSGSDVAIVRAYYKANPSTGAQTITCNAGGTDVDNQFITAVYLTVPVEYVAEDGDVSNSGTTCDTSITTTEPLCLINGFTKRISQSLTLTGGGTELTDTAGAGGSGSRYSAAYLIQSIPGASDFNRSFATSSPSATTTLALRAT